MLHELAVSIAMSCWHDVMQACSAEGAIRPVLQAITHLVVFPISRSKGVLAGTGDALMAVYNVQEVQRWEKDRAEDFGVMLNQFAGMEVAFHERSRDVWQEVAEQMPAAPSPSHQ